jgi:hypothetical protein
MPQQIEANGNGYEDTETASIDKERGTVNICVFTSWWMICWDLRCVPKSTQP